LNWFLAAGLVAVFVGVVLLLSIVIWSIRRHRDPKLHIEYSSPIDELMPSLAGLTLSTAVAGNSVEVLGERRFFWLADAANSLGTQGRDKGDANLFLGADKV
jgi:cardiolipin synthase